MAGIDRLEAMRIFGRIVERRSFTQAAEDLGLPRSSVTSAVQQLEARLGTLLLHRTTRQVSPTLDGEAYYRRSLVIIADVEDAEGAFRGARPRGLLRVDLHGALARHLLLPCLPEFRDRYPEVSLQIGLADQPGAPLRDGTDCLLRTGLPRDGGQPGRRLAVLPVVTCASPAYLQRHGLPQSPAALAGHHAIGLLGPDGRSPAPFAFSQDGRELTVALPAEVAVECAETGLLLARLGLGLIQLPRYQVAEALAAGTLLPVLEAYPPPPLPVSLLSPASRQLTPRVRVFADWMAATLRAASAGDGCPEAGDALF